MDYNERLDLARNGHGILFCGAGFSADCINFSQQDTIGVGADLLRYLNSELRKKNLEYGFGVLRNAAEYAKEKFGVNGLMNLLTARYAISKVSSDMVDIIKYPWERVYTTNYDNAIEICFLNAHKRCLPLNNFSPVNFSDGTTGVVYLHGRAQSWNDKIFEKSCVLGYESYRDLSFLKIWLDFFSQDIDRAQIVVFVGFNANDFHLNEILHNASGLREKIFFVNRASAQPNVDIRMTQSRLGTPLYLGRQGFAGDISGLLKKSPPREPALSSYRRYDRLSAASHAPGTRDIEDLFIFGKFDERLQARDIDLNLQEYHIDRILTHHLILDLKKDVRIAFITGDICDGKTITTQAIMRKLATERSVFVCKIPYDDILDETARLLGYDQKIAIVIENCFEINRDRLLSITRQISVTESVLILTSRNISAEANVDTLKKLRDIAVFREYKIGQLGGPEVDILIDLSDQIAGWSEFRARSLTDRRRFVTDGCKSSLPSFLLRLLHSQYVGDRYREEYNRLSHISIEEKWAIVTAMYVAHIGERASTSLLSEAFGIDVRRLVERLESGGQGFRLLRIRGDFVETLPSIGATNFLKNIIQDSLIIEAVNRVLLTLSASGRRDYHREYIFNQMMRYSIMSPVVDDSLSITAFFDKLSKIETIRRKILFWLQWSIALREREEFLEADQKLQQGYREAELYEKKRGLPYDRRQLDDVKAKLMISHCRKSANVAGEQIFRDIRESCNIVTRLIRGENITHHPFETIKMICMLYSERGADINDALAPIATKQIGQLLEFAETKLGQLPLGYQTGKASESLRAAKDYLIKTKGG